MTALRALMIELGLTDNVTNRLRGIDSQINGMEAGLAGTQQGFGALERATKDYGYTAGKEIEGVGKEVSELDKQVEEHADVTKKATEAAGKSWAKLGAAIGAAGIATEAYLRSQQDYYLAGDKIAYMTGMDRREVVGLATEMRALSTTFEDAYGAMEIGAKQGLATGAELKEYVSLWSSIATASGESATELAQASVALRSVGIEARDLAGTTDTFGFVMQKPIGSVSDFLHLTGTMAKDMDAYGMEISDVAVLLAAMAEKGMAATDANRALRSAMSSAKGDTTALYRELKITDGQLARLNAEIEGSADYIARMNEAFDESQTPLQWTQMKVDTLAHTLGADLNPLLEAGSVGMSLASSAMLTAAGAAYLYSVMSTTSMIPALAASTAAAWAFTTALLANPLTWVVVGVVALGAALYLLHTRWDDISGWFMDKWDAVTESVSGATKWIRGAWDNTVGALISGANWLIDHMGILAFLFPVTAPIAGMNLLRDNWDTVVAGINDGWNALVGAAQDGAAWLSEVIGGGLSQVKELFFQYHPLGIVISQWDDIVGYLRGIDLFEIGRDILLGFVGGILDVREHLFDTVKGIGTGIVESITGFFGIRSPSKLMEQMGGFIGEGFVIGLEQSMPTSLEVGITPHIGDPGSYTVAATTPGVSDATGIMRYTSVVSAPAVSDVGGRAVYRAVFTEPAVNDLAGVVVYQSVVDRPSIEDAVGAAIYRSTIDTPAADDLAGRVTYQAALTAPTVPVLAGETVYTSSLAAPVVTDLAGVVAYRSTVDTPAIEDLVGRVMYRSQVDDVAVGDLTGNVAYRATIGDLTVPTLAGATVYTSSLTEPPVGDLTGRVAYRGLLSEPPVDDLDGTVRYGALVQEVEPAHIAGRIEYQPHFPGTTPPAIVGEATYTPSIGDLTRTVEYQPHLAGLDLPGLVGESIYTSTLVEPTIRPLRGEVEYQGVLTGVPDISGLERGPDIGLAQTDNTTLSWTPPESDWMGRYTPETDARAGIAPEQSGDVNFNTEIHVTAPSGDANEIATVVDRRLRQTFDRHADVYFGRQRRRMAG